MRIVAGWIFICLLFSFSAIAQPANSVKLKGKLVNFSNQVEVADMSEFQYLLPESPDRLIIPDENGLFEIAFPLASPNYFRIGRNALYFSPGDDMEVLIDYNDPRKAVFSGKGSVANIYMKGTPFPKGGSFLEAGRNFDNGFNETLAKILPIASAREKELKALKGVSKTFVQLEMARIKADLINSIKAGESYGPMILKLKGDSAVAFKTSYATEARPALAKYGKGFIDASLMKIVVYRDISNLLVELNPSAKGIGEIKAWQESYSLVRKMQAAKDKGELKNMISGIDDINVPAYRDAVQVMAEKLLAFGKGDPAIDFTAVTPDGNKVNLSSLKGKVIYVDLWATWCGPCMAEMPHFEKLKARYAGNPNVAFVSLSIDSGIEIWKKNLDLRQPEGIQWQINRKKLADYSIVGIPRVLLIDKNFTMANMNAANPSSKAAIEQIENLLK